MSADDRARAPHHQLWPTWPTPGIPMAPEAWRRDATPARSLVRSASVVALAFVLSRVLGLVREVLLAYRFGTSGDLDAYVAAFRVPDLLFLIIMAGSFGSAFIPVFAGLLGRGEEAAAWRLASVVLNYAALAMLGGGLLALLLAGPIVRYLVAPGLAPAQQALTVDLMRILLLSPVFLGLGIATKGILEGQDRFALPAFAPIVYNLAIILGTLLLAPRYGVAGVAVGVVVGAAGHALVQAPGLIRSGLRYRPSLDRRTPGLGEVLRLLGPRLVGQAAFQVNIITITWFASGAGEGAIVGLNFAWQLLMLPHGVLALSISTVIFPTMSRLYEQGRGDELRATFGRALRPLLFLTVPAAVGLFAFRTAIVQSILQWGQFDDASTKLVADPLAFFALGLVGYAVVEVLTRAFYAMHDTRTPVVAGVATIGLNLLLAALLVDRLGQTALALSLSLTTTVEAVWLLIVLRARLGGAGRADASWLARVLLAAAFMALIVGAMAPRLTAATEPGAAPRVLQIALFLYALGLAAGSYLLAARLLRLPEVEQAAAQLTRRLPSIGRSRYAARAGRGSR